LTRFGNEVHHAPDIALRFDSPDDAGSPKALSIVWGAKAKPPVFS
jgi:hypothetical protein